MERAMYDAKDFARTDAGFNLGTNRNLVKKREVLGQNAAVG